MAVLAQEEKLMGLIPQRPPMVMIHRLTTCQEREASTEFDITTGCIFTQNGELREPGLIENLAQTAAAWAGYLAFQVGVERPVGFIGMVQNFEVFTLPSTGKTLVSHLEVTHQIMNATVIKGDLKVEGELVARGEMKIFDQG